MSRPVRLVCEQECGYVVWIEPDAVDAWMRASERPGGPTWTDCDFCGAPLRQVDSLPQRGTPFFVNRAITFVCTACMYEPSLKELGTRHCPECGSDGCLYVYTLSDYWRCPQCGDRGPDRYSAALDIEACPRCGYGLRHLAAVEDAVEAGDVEKLVVILGEAFQRDDRKTADKVTRALKKVGANNMEALLVAMSGDNPLVRWTVAELLGEIGGTQAVDVLTAALDDRDAGVREAASVALERIESR